MGAGGRRVVTGLAVLVGIGFIVGGGAKLNDPGRAVELFVSWGVPGGRFIALAGWVEVALGLALLNRPTRPLGAAALGLWMILWGTIQLVAGSSAALASGVVLVLMLLYLLGRSEPLVPGKRWVDSPLRPPPRRFPAVLHRLVRLVGLAFLIRWAIGGVTYWIALPVLALPDVPADGPRSEGRLESVLLHLLVLGIGVSGLWGFVGHTFMSETVSRSVGWAVSPFQKELAFYHLAIGLGGMACWWIRDHFWLAAAAIPSIFLFGAGWVHLVDFVEHGNVAPANWGLSILFGNLIVPSVVLILVAIRSRRVLPD